MTRRTPLALPLLLGVLSALATAGCGDREPFFESVLSPVDTFDTLGPYTVEAWAGAPDGVARITLRLSESAADPRFSDSLFERLEGDENRGRWQVKIPGRPAGTDVLYYLVLVDAMDRVANHPEGAPATGLLGFRVLAP